jgi:small-conductance mechanosensitive channel
VIVVDNNLSDWTNSVQNGVSDAVHQVIVYLPKFFGALVVLLVGVIVAYVLKAIVVRLLKAVKVQPYANKVRLNEVFPGQYNVAELVGDLVKWFFIIVFLLQALSIADLLAVNNLVNGLLSYVPNVLAAVVLVLVGGVVADLTNRVVVNAARMVGAVTAAMLGQVAKYAIWVVVIFTALAQLGVNTLFLDRLFTAIVVMLALAGGLAFGLGGQNAAKDWLESARKSARD